MLKAVDVSIIFFHNLYVFQLLSLLTDPPSVDCDGWYENNF